MKKLSLFAGVMIVLVLLAVVATPGLRSAERSFEQFIGDCRNECAKKHKGGEFMRKGKKYTCSKDVMEELGNGVQNAGISFNDLCPKEYRKWEDQPR